MTATLSPDDNPPTLPAAGTLYGLPELAEALATATRLEEKHMIWKSYPMRLMII